MILLSLVVLHPVFAPAEYRTIAVEISRAKDQSINVTIHSDVKEEKSVEISVEDATGIMKNAKGWGSSVGVAIVTDGVDLRHYLSVIEAIADNIWLDLTVLKTKSGMGDHILTHYGLEGKKKAGMESSR